MDELLTKPQRIQLALLRTQGGTIVIEKPNRAKEGLRRALQALADQHAGVQVIRETPGLVMYRVYPKGPDVPPT